MRYSHIICIFLALLLLHAGAFAGTVKEADLAGSWYPADGTSLSGMLGAYLANAHPEPVAGELFALVSPHAGYEYSGPVAAYGFKALEGRTISTVIVLGFSHRRRFEGISVYAEGSFRTPLGQIAVDTEMANALIKASGRIQFQPALFNDENSVEMQIPFIQKVLGEVKIVPVVFGTQEYGDAEILAHALANVIKDRSDVLVVASTDLSHYHSSLDARVRDTHTIKMIETFRARDLYNEGAAGVSELCGLLPVTATLIAAEKLGFRDISLLKYATSGDMTGENSKVVGYMSAVIYRKTPRAETRPERISRAIVSGGIAWADETAVSERTEGGLPMLNAAQKKRLLEIARTSIASYVRDGKRGVFAESDPLLNKPMGAFVTLHERGELRGCIGAIIGRGPLYKTVADMAVESAIGDPRFPRLTASEIDDVDIEISVLSELARAKSAEEIRIPGHGVVVKRGSSSGVFLPQVADETGWTKEEFLSNLCAHKAGLPADAWKDPRTELYIYSAEVFGEKK